MSDFVKVANRDELAPGGRKVVEMAGRAIGLFRVGGDFYAIDDVCTHDGGPLVEGELHGCEIECPRHGARFDVKTGRALSMPAIEPVTAHAVELRDERARGGAEQPGDAGPAGATAIRSAGPAESVASSLVQGWCAKP